MPSQRRSARLLRAPPAPSDRGFGCMLPLPRPPAACPWLPSPRGSTPPDPRTAPPPSLRARQGGVGVGEAIGPLEHPRAPDSVFPAIKESKRGSCRSELTKHCFPRKVKNQTKSPEGLSQPPHLAGTRAHSQCSKHLVPALAQKAWELYFNHHRECKPNAKNSYKQTYDKRRKNPCLLLKQARGPGGPCSHGSAEGPIPTPGR